MGEGGQYEKEDGQTAKSPECLLRVVSPASSLVAVAVSYSPL